MSRALYYIESVGAFGHMLKDVFKDVSRGGVNVRELARQIVSIGARSLPIVALTAIFSGMVMALQTAHGMQRFGAKNYVGNLVGLALVRELGPVLTAVIVCGRVGAGIAAEIASMVATEQVDAIRALGASPIRKLVTPKILAGFITLPLLVIMADAIGIFGGWLIAVFELDIGSYTYYRSLLYTLQIRDVMEGLIKSAAFGFLLVSLACFKGLHTRGGTEGVGNTTTSSVVTGSIIIFITDFFLTKLMMMVA